MKRLTLILATFVLSVAFAITASASDVRELSYLYHVAFNYEGRAFNPEEWNEVQVSPDPNTLVRSFTSPDGRLGLKVKYYLYPDFPVVEVRPELECLGSEPTGIVDNFKFLRFYHPHESTGIIVRRTTGSNTIPSDFTRHDVLLQFRHECDTLSMTHDEGRSSSWIPYIGIDYDVLNGVEVAIGWSGTWCAEMFYRDVFMFTLDLDGGTHFRMLPGEHFQMPYSVIYERKGKTVEDGQVELHRFMIEHKAPRDAQGNIIKPRFPMTTWGGTPTAEHLRMLDKTLEVFPNVPFDTYWVDAGWYGVPHVPVPDEPGGLWDWYFHAGNWHANTVLHPSGDLKPISDAAHSHGMKFLLWVESERATCYAPIVTEHPEYFHKHTFENYPHDYFNLVDLGNPEARAWITDEVSRVIEENDVDIYRQDFNIDPRLFWRAMDEPDRIGVAEIKHIDGLYAFWDELHRRFPDLMFESCSSGGRRMDIELMSRAHSYCRDDAHMMAGTEEMCQNITLNTTSYIPFTGGDVNIIPAFDTYGWISHIASTTVFGPYGPIESGLTDEAVQWYTKMLLLSKRVQDIFFGDFYVLARPALDNSGCFVGYQVDNKQTGEGFFVIFRREQCPEDIFELRLRDIDPSAKYIVEQFDGRTRKMKGSALARQTLSFPEPRSAQLYFYTKKK